MPGHFLLFSGIVELVFIRSTEAFLDSAIDPQSFHGRQQLFGEWLRVLHARDDVHHHLGVGLRVGESHHLWGRKKKVGRRKWTFVFLLFSSSIHSCMLILCELICIWKDRKKNLEMEDGSSSSFHIFQFSKSFTGEHGSRIGKRRAIKGREWEPSSGEICQIGDFYPERRHSARLSRPGSINK